MEKNIYTHTYFPYTCPRTHYIPLHCLEHNSDIFDYSVPMQVHAPGAAMESERLNTSEVIIMLEKHCIK